MFSNQAAFHGLHLYSGKFRVGGTDSRRCRTCYHQVFGGDNFLPHIATGQDCLKAGDVFLVCSDGLSDVVSKNDIRRTLVSDAYLFVMIGLY